MRTGYDRFMDYHLTHKDHHNFARIATFNSTIIYTIFDYGVLLFCGILTGLTRDNGIRLRCCRVVWLMEGYLSSWHELLCS